MSLLFRFCYSNCRRYNIFLDQVKSRLISLLINGISRVLQKLLKYFNRNPILTSFVLPAAGVFRVILILYLNYSDLLYYHLDHLCNIATNFLMFSNNYHCIRLNYTLASQHLHILHYLSEYYLYYLCN